MPSGDPDGCGSGGSGTGGGTGGLEEEDVPQQAEAHAGDEEARQKAASDSGSGNCNAGGGGCIDSRGHAGGGLEGCGDGDAGGLRGSGGGCGLRFCCTSFVANASVYGHCFQWHVDADPLVEPAPSWLSPSYPNGEAGRPLLVSLVLYVDECWRRDWDAETLLLEQGSGVGLLVQPRPGRAVRPSPCARIACALRLLYPSRCCVFPVDAVLWFSLSHVVPSIATLAWPSKQVLMHQDALHRVSTPSLTARRPRYSLVWKLLFVPRAGGVADANCGGESICRPEWGAPAVVGGALGSAATARRAPTAEVSGRSREALLPHPSAGESNSKRGRELDSKLDAGAGAAWRRGGMLGSRSGRGSGDA